MRVTINFVELSKDYLRNFGFSWIPSLDTGGSVSFGQSTTGGVTSAGSGSLSGTIGNLFPKLASAQNAGYARVLEESVLIVKAGQRAKFVRTLDVPVQTVNDKGQPSFNVVPIGPQIEIVPKIVGQTEDVDMKIDFNYSGLAGKQGNAPIVLKHGYNVGSIVVKSGDSAAIVNAVSNVISTAFNKDPPGGRCREPALRAPAFEGIPEEQEPVRRVRHAADHGKRVQRNRGHQAQVGMRKNSKMPGHIIAVVGGKGGVGKWVFSANLALAYLMELRQRPLLIDLDMNSLGDQNLIMGVRPPKTIVDITKHNASAFDFKTLQPMMASTPQG